MTVIRGVGGDQITLVLTVISSSQTCNPAFMNRKVQSVTIGSTFLSCGCATLNPNVVKVCRRKTRQGAIRRRRTSRRLGQLEAYLTVREILPEASKGVPPKAGLWREFGGFCWFRFAT
jgi:hypothetical protein